jgi:molybdopterin synthase sulfur carrier subunit
MSPLEARMAARASDVVAKADLKARFRVAEIPLAAPDFHQEENDRMAVKVMIPTPLRQFTGKQSSIECNSATVGEALGSLTGTFSELRKHLYTEDGKIRSFVNVYLNDEDIRFLEKENTPTKDGDTISIVPSIAGGLGRLR